MRLPDLRKKSQNAVVTDKRMTPAWFVTSIWSLGK